ncbi:hypothetical protein ARAM_006447 [Aspergillus rambellii]|uniref:Defective in cullin neddylation protein n=1 Tax=Aspergillus rambellii TaxID=308745 RepID=A0A0F8UMQ8_9EURO|nr:hypothetical protein ARAM_006447 [Aspergillus rambellii]
MFTDENTASSKAPRAKEESPPQSTRSSTHIEVTLFFPQGYPSPLLTKLTAPESPEDNPDGIGIEGAIRFLGDIQVELDEVACLAIAELLQCPSMGEFTREGFLNDESCDTIEKMTTHAANLRARIPLEPALFRRVYRFTFPLCLVQGQRNLQFEIAAEQWKLLFTPGKGGIQWTTQTSPWLNWWIEFLEGRGKRPVNKDLWQQVEVFMRKTQEDEAFGWWSVDGAWPGALDDFVAWVKEKRGKGGEDMEVE